MIDQPDGLNLTFAVEVKEQMAHPPVAEVARADEVVNDEEDAAIFED